MKQKKIAPGRPGVTPPWTPSNKTGIGKALNAGSHITFSIARGVITESYYPREDTPCLGESVCIVTDSQGFFSDERTDASHDSEPINDQVPGYILTNTCRDGRYTITKEIIADPLRNCLLQNIRFNTTESGLRLHLVTIPRFAKEATMRMAYTDELNGVQMLFGETEGMAIAIACSSGFLRRSVGYFGKSDGLTQLRNHGTLKNEYGLADNGNIVLSGQLETDNNQDLLLVTAFGHSKQEAGHNALACLLTGFEEAKKEYVSGWKDWHKSLWTISDPGARYPLLHTSATILRVSESKLFPGAVLASLSIPWGATRVEDSLGAYHLVWPRDLVLSSGGLAALDDRKSVARILNYLMTTQLENGSWPQNMWLDGTANWSGIQLDQVAMPVSLVDFCRTAGILDRSQLKRYWRGIQRALDFIVNNGPASDQDRWEEQSGTNPFTLATQVIALVAGANLAGFFDYPELGKKYFEKADEINNRIEELTYVTGTDLCEEYGVEGYYIRINPGLTPVDLVKNQSLDIDHPVEKRKLKVSECIGVDALALVRFGLRSAHDPKILNTVRVIDATLKVELSNGTGWRRYVGDVYGEDKEGNPYTEGEGSGTGRVWPLLTGERAHYEIAAGNFRYATELLESLNNFAANKLLPEQTWDAADLPSKQLYNGQPSGSAMPLTWAHSEYIKLCRSLEEKKVFDLPLAVFERYVKNQAITD